MRPPSSVSNSDVGLGRSASTQLLGTVQEHFASLSEAVGNVPHVLFVTDDHDTIMDATAPNDDACFAPFVRGAVYATWSAARVALQTALIEAPDGGRLGALHLATSRDAPRLEMQTLLLHSARLLGRAAGGTAVSRRDYYEIIAGISRFTAHTLGNPLTGMGLTLDLLAGMVKQEDQQRLLSRCQRLNERLSVFKENLGALGGSLKGQQAPTALRPLLQQVLEGQRLGSAYQTPIEIGNDVGDALVCHPGLLMDALTYLLRNASDIIPDGGTIGIRVGHHAGMVRITVWDDGPGASPELAARFFNAPVSSKAHGLGLGLLLVAMIVEHIHGGRVSYAPNRPHGALFHLDFPNTTGSRE